MDVNYEVWGQPEEWQNISNYSWAESADCKIPKSGRTSYYNAFNAGALEGGVVPTDLSLAYWGIGEGSILAHPMYLSPYWDSDTIKTAANQVQEPKTVPCILNWATDPSGTQADMSWNYRYAPTDNPGQDAWRVENLIGISAYSRILIASFNYQKIYLIPYVKVAAAGSSSWSRSTVSLKEYMDGMTDGGTYENYNKVVGIGYRIAIGDGINNNRSTDNKEMGMTFPVSFEASQRSYESGSRTYTWFATRYGIEAFMTNLTLNSQTHSLTPYREWSAENFSNLHLVGDADTGWRRKYCQNYYAGGNMYGQVPIYYYNPDDDIWKINDSLPWNPNYADPFPYIECTPTTKDAVKDYVMKQIAYLGFPFIYDPALAARGQIGDAGVYLPEFDDDGITTGNYAEGRAALRLPNSEWVDGRTGSGYDPTKPPGPGPEDSTDWQRNPTSTTQSGSWPFIGSTLYAMTQNRFNSAYNWMQSLYAECLEAFNEDRMKDTFLNFGMGMSIADVKLKYRLARLSSNMNSQNYLDSVMSVMRYPFDVRPYLNTIDAEGIHWGSVYQDDDNSGIVVNPTTFEVKGWGSGDSFMVPGGTLHYDRYYGNFLDYAPYSEAELYIPYCGAVKLDPQVYCGHNIKVNYLVDFNSGACLALIYRDNLICDQISGQMGIPINFTAPDIQSYNNSIFNGTQVVKANQQALTYNLASNALEFSKEGTSIAQEAAASYAKKDIAGMANALPNPFDVGQQALNFSNQLSTNLRNLKTAEYNLEHVQLGFKQISSSSTQTSSMNEQTVRLIVYRPTFLPEYRSSTGAADKYESDKFKTYAHTTGFACLINGSLSGFTGLTICGSVNTDNINATESEKNLLETALKTGVYL